MKSLSTLETKAKYDVWTRNLTPWGDFKNAISTSIK